VREGIDVGEGRDEKIGGGSDVRAREPLKELGEGAAGGVRIRGGGDEGADLEVFIEREIEECAIGRGEEIEW
jgi:hypothetical protein